MSKELTEQWRNGTIDWGLYYVKVIGLNDITIADTNLDEELNVDEVLAKVPTYDEYLKLESDSLAKQEGVELVSELENKLSSLSLQLKEANEVIKHYSVGTIILSPVLETLTNFPRFRFLKSTVPETPSSLYSLSTLTFA